MLETRSYAERAKELLRESLLDAAGELVGAHGWGAVRMLDVATTAGVSRQTVYNEFGSRAGLAQAFVMRETDRFLTAVEAAVLDSPTDPHEALTRALTVFLTAAADNPLFRSILGGDDELLVLITVQGREVLQTATTRLADVLARTWPVLGESSGVLLAETVVRIAISQATLPGGPEAVHVVDLLSPWITERTGIAPA